MFLKRASKQLQRVGSDAIKVAFTVEVESVQMSDVSGIESGSILSICFERGGKLVSSKNKEFLYPTGLGSKEFKVLESLTLMATLYRDPATGRFQDKKGKLIFRKLKKTRLGGDAYFGLGYVVLELHKLATEASVLSVEPSSSGKYFSLPLLKLPGAILKVKITARSVAAADDDTRSMMSGISDSSELSTVGATFDADLESSSSNSTSAAATTTTGNSLDSYKLGRRIASVAPPTRLMSSVRLDSTSQKMDGTPRGSHVHSNASSGSSALSTTDDQPDTTSTPSPSPLLTAQGHSPTAAPNNGETSCQAEASITTTPAVHSDSEALNSPVASTNIQLPVTDPTPTSAPVQYESKLTVQTGSVSLPGHEDILCNYTGSPAMDSEGFKVLPSGRTSQEVVDLLAERDQLKKALSERDKTVSDLERQLQTQGELHVSTVTLLKTELKICKSKLDREQAARLTIEAANDKADGVLASLLSQTREETEAITLEYARVAAELESQIEGSERLNESLVRTQALLKDECEACIAAATAAAVAAMRRAEVEDELNWVVEQLIASKLSCADLCMSVDEESKKVYICKRRLQAYAERVAVLELSLARAVANAGQVAPLLSPLPSLEDQ